MMGYLEKRANSVVKRGDEEYIGFHHTGLISFIKGYIYSHTSKKNSCIARLKLKTK